MASPLTFFLSQGFTRDWHLHDSHSHDGRGMPEDFARAALAKGIRSICITSHIETFNPEKQRYEIRLPGDAERLEKSRRAIERARERVPGVEIKFGVELENNPGYYPQMEEILGRFEFDCVIGSVHNIGGRTITSPFCTSYLASQPPADVYARYYEEMAAFTEWGRFDVLGHADIVRRYMLEVFPGFRPIVPYDVLRNVFTLMRTRGQGLEINSSGLYQAARDIYPTAEILGTAMECGIERLTLGSDAHRPEDTGRGFERVRDILEKSGGH